MLELTKICPQCRGYLQPIYDEVDIGTVLKDEDGLSLSATPDDIVKMYSEITSC